MASFGSRTFQVPSVLPDPESPTGDTVRRNYLAHAIEGGLFIGGLAFTNANTLLPTVVQSLGGPPWLISMMPIMMGFGFLLPPIFTAHWIQRLPHYMPLLMVTGLIQRLPYLLAGAALVFASTSNPRLALAAVVLAPFVSGFMGGISVTAWQQLFANTVPENRRSSLFALRYIGASLLGIAAGYVVKIVLKAYPGASGYAILHLCTFASLMASYGLFATIREPRAAVIPASHSIGLIANLAAMPALIRGDRSFLLFLLARFFRNGVFVLTPFLAIHCQMVLNKPESYLGQLVVVQMIGAIIGNAWSGYVGDRLGGKSVMVTGTAVLVALSAWAIFASTGIEFQTIFFLFGFGFFASEVGNMSLALEICRPENRSSYLAIGSLINLPAMLLASWSSTTLWEPEHHFGGVAVCSVACLVLSIAFLVPIRDPRLKREKQFATDPDGRVAFPSESAEIDT